jgi:hypothetical protein
MAPAKEIETETVSTRAPSPTETTPTIHEQIVALAYSLWKERGCPEGSPEVDWFKAEAELTTEKK